MHMKCLNIYFLLLIFCFDLLPHIDCFYLLLYYIFHLQLFLHSYSYHRSAKFLQHQIPIVSPLLKSRILILANTTSKVHG